MSPRERRLLPILAAFLLALAAYVVSTRSSTAQPGSSPELENFRSSEQIGVDVSVSFPVDI